MACDSVDDDVSSWLRSMHLDCYEAAFLSHGYQKLRDCRDLSREFLADMGISLPGHRSRILMQLRRTFSHTATWEAAVTPECGGDFVSDGNDGSAVAIFEPVVSAGGGSLPWQQSDAFSTSGRDPAAVVREYENFPLPLPPPLPAKQKCRKATGGSESPSTQGSGAGSPLFDGDPAQSAERPEQKAATIDSPSPGTPPKLPSLPPTAPDGPLHLKTPVRAPDAAGTRPPSADELCSGGPWPDTGDEPPSEMMDNDIYEEFGRCEETTAVGEAVSPSRDSTAPASRSSALQNRPLPIPCLRIMRRKSGTINDSVAVYEAISDIPATRGLPAASRGMEDDINAYEEVEYVETRGTKPQPWRQSPVVTPKMTGQPADVPGGAVVEAGFSPADNEGCVYSLLSDDDIHGAAQSEPVYSTGDDDGGLMLIPRPLSGDSGAKAGWLDKQAPQGPYIFQKRWVKSDGRYFYYYINDKEVYSKGVLPLCTVQEVLTHAGDTKFEVVTHARAFVFRADSEAERSAWVLALREAVQARRPEDGGVTSVPHGTGVIPGEETPWGEQEKRGTLELRGKAKVYVISCSDRLWLFKSEQDFRTSMGITCIEMNVANVRAVDKKVIDLTTPFKTFSFVAENERDRDDWLKVMENAIATSLSSSDVAEQVWANEQNRRCADCSAAWPDWASVNLCVVICKRCAGEHRYLGQTVSKVRSLKMDKTIWTQSLIELFQELGNSQVNKFWAAAVPPSEALVPNSEPEQRRQYIFAKYREGRYRCYHPSFGSQSDLSQALCRAVVTPNLLETLALVFCGANMLCCAGEPDGATPPQLAHRAGQRLQSELLLQNRNSTIPGSTVLPSLPAIVSGYLYKTPSITKVLTDRKPREEFCRRWCVLGNGVLTFYESDRSATPSGRLELQDLASLAVSGAHSHPTHGMEHTFEICTKNEKLFLFGTDCATTHREWVLALVKALPWPGAEALCRRGFDRMGPLLCRDGRSQVRWRPAMFALYGASLRFRPTPTADPQAEQPARKPPLLVQGRASPPQEGVYEIGDDDGGGDDGENDEDGDDERSDDTGAEMVVNLQKLQEISVHMSDHIIEKYETLILVEKRRMLYLQSDTRLNFAAWRLTLEQVARGGGRLLDKQQLLDGDVPVVLGRCMEYITQYGLTSEGIYRKSGTTSRTRALLDEFWRDARTVRLREGEHTVDDVANVLKRFLRELQDGIMPAEARHAWTRATDIRDDSERLRRYRDLVKELPRLNRATLAALIEHLYCVQLNANLNQMSARNLSIVFGPTLFQSEGSSQEEGHVVETLINNYIKVFEVDEERFQNVLHVTKLIVNGLAAKQTHDPARGGLIVSVYVERKSTDTCISLKVSGVMTAQELLLEVLDLRQGHLQHVDYATAVFEVSGELERPLHYKERVLDLFFNQDSQEHYLLVKRHPDIEGMKRYLDARDKAEWQGPVRFREERSSAHSILLQTGKFNERHVVLGGGRLLIFKDRKTSKAERDWSLQTVKVFLGIRRKLKAPTSFGLTLLQDKQRWALCFESHQDRCDCLATILSVQHKGDMWAPDKDFHNRTSSLTQRLGSQILIPLRGGDKHRLTLTASMAFKESDYSNVEEGRPDPDGAYQASPWPHENDRATFPDPRLALLPPSRHDQIAAGATHGPLVPPLSSRQGPALPAAANLPSLRPQHKITIPSAEQQPKGDPHQADQAVAMTPPVPNLKPRQQLGRSPQHGPQPVAVPMGVGQGPRSAAQTPSTEMAGPVWPTTRGPRTDRQISARLDGQLAMDSVAAHFNVIHELSSVFRHTVELENVKSSEV